MSNEDEPIKVRYKYDNGDKDGDLVCELTEFMDNYLIGGKLNYCCTYLYNDIGSYSFPNFLQIAFRYPRSYKGWHTFKKIR